MTLPLAATATGARIGVWLFGARAPDPPDDAHLYAHWKRRRRWIVFSELAALPAYPSLAISAVAYWGLDDPLVFPIVMLLASSGFLLITEGLQRHLALRLGIPTLEDGDDP